VFEDTKQNLIKP